MRPTPALAALCAAALAALAAPAQAQDVAAARKMFDQGLADMEAGNFDKGCPALDASYKLDPRPGTLFTLAECNAKWGRLATAVARYEDYLATYARLTPDQQRKQADRPKTAQDQKAALAPEVPELTLSLAANAPKDTTVKRDGTELAPAMLGVALPVDPGDHTVTTQAPGGPVTETRVTIAKGEKKQIALEVKPPLPGSASKRTDETRAPVGASSDTEPPDKRNPLPALITGSAALVVIGVGGGLYGASQAKRTSTLDFATTVAKTGGTCLGKAPDPRCTTIDSMARQVDTFHNVAVGAFIGASALAVATVVYVLWPAPTGKKTAQQRRGVELSPILGAAQGGMVVSGDF